jgi:hypothetical protein
MLLGIIFVVLGSFILWDTIKNPIVEDLDYGKGQFKGYLSGIGFVVLGLYLIIRHFAD